MFDTTPFLRFGTCGEFPPWLLALLVASDLAITLAYIGIPLALLVGLRRSRQIRSALLGRESRTITLLFVVFILGCGATHACRALMAHTPAYYLTGAVNVFTAAVSLLTLAALLVLGPRLAFFQLGSHDEIATLERLAVAIDGLGEDVSIEDRHAIVTRLRASQKRLQELGR